MTADQLLPPGNFFAVWRLAKILDKHRDHIARLVDTGEIEVAIDARGKASSRASLLIPRAAVIAFLERRRVRNDESGHAVNGGH
jgi:hypothetical protein